MSALDLLYRLQRKVDFFSSTGIYSTIGKNKTEGLQAIKKKA